MRSFAKAQTGLQVEVTAAESDAFQAINARRTNGVWCVDVQLHDGRQARALGEQSFASVLDTAVNIARSLPLDAVAA